MTSASFWKPSDDDQHFTFPAQADLVQGLIAPECSFLLLRVSGPFSRRLGGDFQVIHNCEEIVSATAARIGEFGATC